jgi:hypothetical protein
MSNTYRNWNRARSVETMTGSGGDREGGVMVFGALEEIFFPSAAKAREERDNQKLIGETAPAPADPPRLDPPGLITDGPSKRFTGKVVIRSKP